MKNKSKPIKKALDKAGKVSNQDFHDFIYKSKSSQEQLEEEKKSLDTWKKRSLWGRGNGGSNKLKFPK